MNLQDSQDKQIKKKQAQHPTHRPPPWDRGNVFNNLNKHVRHNPNGFLPSHRRNCKLLPPCRVFTYVYLFQLPLHHIDNSSISMHRAQFRSCTYIKEPCQRPSDTSAHESPVPNWGKFVAICWRQVQKRASRIKRNVPPTRALTLAVSRTRCVDQLDVSDGLRSSRWWGGWNRHC